MNLLNNNTANNSNSSNEEFVSILEAPPSNSLNINVLETVLPEPIMRRPGLRSGTSKEKPDASTPAPQTRMKKTYVCQGCKKSYKGIVLHQKSCPQDQNLK